LLESWHLRDRDLPSFPYTTLFRSVVHWRLVRAAAGRFGPSVGDGVPDLVNDVVIGHRVLFHCFCFLSIAVATGRLSVRGGSWCRSEEHTSELQSRENLVCRLLLEK